jgi:uncharacterized protein DUF6572
MTLETEGTIDFVAHDPAHDEALLVMVRDQPWADAGHHLPPLQAKFNTYFAYATSGSLVAAYPELSGKSVHIQLRSTTPPGERELEFLRIVATHHLRPAGIRLSWRVIGEPHEHGI